MKRMITLFVLPSIYGISRFIHSSLSRNIVVRIRGIIVLLAFCFFSSEVFAQQASGILVSPIAGSTTSLKLDWTNGGGTSRIVVIRAGGSTWVPTNTQTYTATTAFPADAATGTGPDFDAAGSGKIAAVVFNGGGTTVNVTNLAAGTFYTVQVYEYIAGPTYDLTTGTNNPRGAWYATGNTNYIVPAGSTSINVQAWGGGGAGGGSGSATNGRAGGGGGAYVTGTITTTPSTSYAIVMGTGGPTSANNGTATTFGGAALFSADFGLGGLDAGDVPGVGGLAANSVVTGTATGVVKTNGATGGNRANPAGGVGGDAGNTTGTGGTAVASANGNPGKVPGGGGAGGGLNSEGGAGANGLVIVTNATDITPPTATIIREPATANTYSTNATIQFKVTFNEAVNNVTADDFQAAGTGTVTSGPIVTITGSGPYIVTVPTVAGDGTLDLNFAGGQNITDVVGNAFGGTTSGDEIYNIDNTNPTVFAVGAVLTVGGNIVGGFYNNTNTGITVAIPIDNDPSLVGGNIQLRIDDDGNSSYNDLGTTVPIPTANTTQVVNITEAQLTATSEFADPSLNPITFTAIVTDAAGNSSTFTVSGSTLQRSEAAPTAPSVPDLIVASDAGASSTDNITNDNTPTFSVTGSAGLLLQILEGSNVIAFTNSALGTPEQLTASTLSDNSSYSITARVTNAAGSIANSAAMAPVLNIDTAPPPTPTVPDLQNGSDSQGVSNTDNITNDLTPTFDITGTNTLRLDLMEGSNILATAASATGASQALTSSSLTTGNTYSVFAKTTDVAGNTAVSATLDVTIDNQAPSVTSITPEIDPSLGRILKTGTITATTGSATVNGSSTLFQSELFVGAVIMNASGSQAIGTVLSIASDTQLTLTANASNAITAGNYSIRLFFNVTFNEPLTTSTITTGDFVKGTGTATGNTISAVGAVTAGNSSQQFKVSVTASGNGTWRLDKNNNSYSDIAGNASTTTFNGTVANIDNAAPTVQSIVRQTPIEAYSQATTVTYTVTFSEDVTGVDPTDFTKTITGITAGAITVTPVSASVYDVQVASISTVNGTLRLDVPGSATISDMVGNAFTTAFTTGEVYNFDYTNPAPFNVGNVASTAGRVRPYYYNLTNTGVNVTVPIANDASLNGGNVQLMARLLPAGSFADVGLPSTIAAVNANKVVSLTAADLVAYLVDGNNIEFTAKITDQAGNGPITGTASTISLTVDLVRPTVSVTPRVFDNKGGGPNNGGATNNNEVIEFTVNEPLYNSATIGTITSATNSTTVTGVGTNFTKLVVGGVITNGANASIGTIQSITSDLSLTLTGNASIAVSGVAFKFRGISTLLGLTTSTGAIGITQYINDGTTNTVDNSLTNTRLIYVESSANNSGWTTTTSLSYTQSAGGSTAGNYLFDAAGNELNSFSLTCSSGDIIPPSVSPNVMTLFPRSTNPEKITFTLSEALSTATTSNAVTGFSTTGSFPDASIGNATYSEASPGICPCTITLTSAVNGSWTGATQVWYDQATGNVLDLAGVPNELGTTANHAVVVETVAPSITSVSIPVAAMKVGSVVTATIAVANDDGDTPVLTSGTIGGFPLSILNFTASPTSKTVQFTVTEGGADVAGGADIPIVNLVLTDGQGNGSTVFATPISQGGDPIDAHSPTITSITNTLATIYEGAKTQTVTVQYNETMNTAVQPVISLSGGSVHWGAQTASGGTNGWVANIYTATFTHDGFQEPANDPSISVTSSVAVAGAQDAAGNPNLGTATSTAFLLDTKKPTATVSVSPSVINLVNDILTVTVDFSKAMNPSVAPAVTFNIGTGSSNFNPTAAGVWSNGNKRYVRSYQQLNNLTSLINTVSVNSGQDVAGNVQTASAASGNFVIDRDAPTVSSVNRVTSQSTNLTTVQYNVTFSEVVTGLTNANFDHFVVSGSVPGTVTGFTTSDNITFLVSVFIGAGNNGQIRLDVNTSGAVVDARGNAFSTAFNTGQVYDVDTTPPVAQDIYISSPLISWNVQHNATASSTLTWLVKFSEPVTGVNNTANFTLNRGTGTDLTFSPLANADITTSDNITWTVTLNNVQHLTTIASNTQLFINLFDNNSIIDAAGNSLGGPVVGDGNLNSTIAYPGTSTPGAGLNNDFYTIVFPEPSNPPSNILLVANTPTSINVSWNQPVAPPPITTSPNYYFFQIKRGVDGAFLPNYPDGSFSNPSIFTSNPGTPTMTRNFTNSYVGLSSVPLQSGFDYNIRILSTSYSGFYNSVDLLDYLTSATLDGTFQTTTASSAVLSNVVAAPTISSTTTSNTLALAQTNANFSFDIRDEASDQDNAPFKFSGLVIKQNNISAANDITDWTQAIQTAYLTSDGIFIDSSAVITTNQIQFSAIPSTYNALGYVADGTTKNYKLYIRLKKSLGGTLPSTIDGLNFAFLVDNSSFTLDDSYDPAISQATSSQRSTTLIGGQQIFTPGTNNRVTVTAEKLVFRTPGTPGTPTEPQPQIGLATPFSAVPLATRPTVRALDRYNNLDLGYSNSANIGNTLNLSQSIGSISFVNGVLALDPLSFTTHNASATKITVAGTGLPSVTPATSADVNTFISNLTTITDGLTAPGSELANFTSITNTTPALYNFDFRISDDVGADATNFSDNDGLPTLVQTITITQGVNNGDNNGGTDVASFDNWSKSILGAQLKAVGSTQTVSGSVTANSLVFNIPAGSFMENVPNDGSTDYELRIWLKNPIDSTGATNLRTILDNKDYSFAIDISNIAINSTAPNNTSTRAATGGATTGDNRNQVQVHATKLKFPIHPATSQQYDAAITPSPVVWATDANGNIDLGYTGTPTVTTVPNGARTYPPLAGTNTLTNSSGTITFDNTGPDVYTLTSAGGGFSGDLTRLVVSGGLNDQSATVTAATSNTFSQNYSNTSDIVRDGSFTHPTDIEYYLTREAVNITTGNSIALDRFTLRDGGSSFTDSDGSKTRLQSITLNVTNFENIRLIGLFDETGAKLQQLDSTFFSATGDITFSSLAVFEDDDNNLDAVLKKFTVRASFRAFVSPGVDRDNQQINVSVVSATAAGVSSQLISPLTIPGDNLGTDKNKIEVKATRIDFTTIPATASISVPIAPPNAPQIVVSARDAFANLDTDYNGPITGTSNNDVANFHTLNDPTGNFSLGKLTYPNNFQFDVGNGNVQLTINAGPGTGANNINAGALIGLSPIISVISSFESRIAMPTGYTLPLTIDYVNHQSANLATTDDSFELVQYVVADGTADGPADGDTPGIPGDLDGAATVLNNLKIGITNYTAVRSIAIYNSAGVRIRDGVIAPVAGILGEVTFDLTVGGNEIIAGDDAEKLFSIRATFQSSPTLVSDTMHIRVSLRSAVLGVGSKFYDVPPSSGNYVVGNPPGTINVIAPKTKNEIDVTATSLDFVTAASPFAGINEPVGPTYTTPPQPSTSAAIVHARDKFGVLDLGFHNISVTSIAGASTGVSDTSDFNYGVLDLDGMQYTSAGDGKLTVIAGGIDSSNPVCGSCNSIPGQPVDVINVSVTPAASGVLTTSNIKGGTQGAVIFGVTFTPDHSTTAQPSLSEFTFTFDFPYRTATTTIFKNFVVKEGGSDVVNSYTGATVTEVSSTNDTNFDLIKVTFAGVKPELFDPSTGSATPRTFHLSVDVDLTANISTQNLTPQLIDAGYNTTTDNNIVLTQGTATANVIGQTYQFASTRPPVLQTSKDSKTLPYRGQLNVDANLNRITLEFDVQVWSLDGKAKLFDSETNTQVADLVAVNGVYVNASTLPEDSIVYDIVFLPGYGPNLIADNVYYVAVAKGSFNNVTNTGEGISDNGFNFYGGTSFNGTLYFKVSSTDPPFLSSATSYFSNLTTGVFSTTFDKTGTAYYMVLDHNTFVAQGNGATNTPTIADIEDPDGSNYKTNFPGSVITFDRYEITQISSPQYVSFNADLIAGRQYDVWVYANSDAEPDTIAAPQPYGGQPSGYVIGGAGPTIKITLPTAANIKQTKIPDFLLCPESPVILTEPIVLSEQANGSFAAVGTLQEFYLLLPTGFQFAGSDDDDLPTVQLTGNDFNMAFFDVEFINNTIVRIQYKNETSTDLDNIIITDLKLIGVPGSSGDIKRFGGNAILPVLTNNKLASVTVLTNQPLKFTNSYSRDNDFSAFGFLPGADLPPGEPAIIKAIPDNYIDPILGGSIRLVPINSASNDYAPSEFLGNGVTNDVLSLGAVPLDAAFDITISHVSVNGCVVESSEQYVVYDHVSPISLDLGITQNLQHIGSKQSLVNPNFQTDLSLSPGYAPSPSLSADQINSGDIAGYKLLNLYATIPTNLVGSQIISGADWDAQVAKIPFVVNTIIDNTSPTGSKKDYKWDYTHIINAKRDRPAITTDPYDNFRDTTLNNTIFWKGGSLGKIEFTGRYQSTADLTLTVPFKQQVELFVPPIPKIEVSGSSAVVADTAIFCRSQSSITLNGWPDANAGLSTGYFELFDAQTNAPIHTVASPNAGFTDNGNGVAALQPGVLFNNYRTIRVEYTFNENNSPSKGTGYYYIKVTPNPVASFTANSVMASAQPIDVGRPSALNAYCENNPIQFDNTSTFPAAGYVANTNPSWTLGDPLSADNNQSTSSALFTYTANGRYIVTFSVQSQYGCPSQVVTDSIFIGALPNATFDFSGISTATPITVVDKSTVADGPGTNSKIFSAGWTYSPPFSASTNTFTAPGHYTITLLSTTEIRFTNLAGDSLSLPGCERTVVKPVIIVPSINSAAVGAESIDDFESADPLKQWQESSTDNLVSSWERGDATESPLIGNGKVWATGLTSDYNPGEVSFLYSPAYDLSNLARPKVSFDHVAHMDVNDGVVLEFSSDNYNIADPLKKWYRIGTNVDGNNWYNRVGLASSPGDQTDIITGFTSGDYGWSTPLDTVLHSQHTLSPDIPVANRTQVIFRFALASRPGKFAQGFAFDNFRVGERTRVVLIENFTNAGNTNSINGSNVEKRESDFLKSTFNTVGTDIVKINYHVAFPNLDPFNDDYPADPSARALYYNISETPLARMDGSNSNDPQKKYFSDWGVAKFNIRTLKLAQADLQIINLTTSANGGYEFSVQVTAKAKLSMDTTILHVAFVEASPTLNSTDLGMVATGETTFEYVMKKMVPSALGTRLDIPLIKGQTKTFGPFVWDPDLEKLYPSAGDLAIIVFLQNEITKEVYQAEILNNLTDPALVTNVEDPDYATKINLFPNPANNEVNIQLPGAVSKSTPVEMFDTYGKTVYQSSFKVGEQTKTISTSELVGGVYFIQLSTPDGNIVRRKVMVVHR